MRYEPTLESLQQHVVPEWFHDAKLGVFVHWGLYSVPGWAPNAPDLSSVMASGNWKHWFSNNPYAEWYQNSLRIPGTPTQAYHASTFGANVTYEEMAARFDQANSSWDPNVWATLFQQVGARYVVLTTKHHDGYLLWPSRHPNPFRPSYMARRDLVGDLTSAVRAHGMRMGLYYSGGLDWTFEQRPIEDVRDLFMTAPQGAQYVSYANSHWRELIERYEPCVLWNDISYPNNTDVKVLFADYLNRVPDGLVNDRFIQPKMLRGGAPTTDGPMPLPKPEFADYRTPEYTSFPDVTPFKWEACRGIGHSFGYNRNEGPAQYLAVDKLVHLLVDIVSKNGNLLLNVGPEADGTIPRLQVERLEGLGKWLLINGEAIFGTRPWVVAEGACDQGLGVRYTAKGQALYATLLGRPSRSGLSLKRLRAEAGTRIALLGSADELSWRQAGDELVITLPGSIPATAACSLEMLPRPTLIA